MAICINTDHNIYDLKVWGKKAIAGKKPTILVLAIYVEMYILLFLWDLHYPGRAAYLFSCKRTRTVLPPWSSLTSHPGRLGDYGIEYIYFKYIQQDPMKGHNHLVQDSLWYVLWKPPPGKKLWKNHKKKHPMSLASVNLSESTMLPISRQYPIESPALVS